MEHSFHDIVNLGFISIPIFSNQNVLFVETSKLTFFYSMNVDMYKCVFLMLSFKYP